MAMFYFDLMCVCLAAGAGTVFGFLLRSSVEGRRRGPVASAEQDVPSDRLTPEAARESLRKLRELAQKMADDLGVHNREVEKISSDLSEGECPVEAAVERLLLANRGMREQLTDAEGRLKLQAQLIEIHVSEARTDALTGLGNRRAFDDEIAARVRSYYSNGESVAVVLLDVDHFKQFNDTYGHAAGDEVLRRVGRALGRQGRTRDLITRYGGEEFALIYPETTRDTAALRAEQARQAIGEIAFDYEGHQLHVTASCGLAMIMPDDTADSLVRRSDEALYEAKRAGRDRGYWHDGIKLRPLVLETAPRVRSATSDSAGHSSPDKAESAAQGLPELSTREVFEQDLSRRYAEYRRYGTPISVMMIRVDRFPEIASTLGHEAREVLMRVIARFLIGSTRSTDHIARYSSDTFSLLLPSTRLADAGRVAERFRAGLADIALTVGEEPLRFTVSIGVGEEVGNNGTPPLIDRISAAVAKASGRGNCVVCSDSDGFVDPAELIPSEPKAMSL